MRTTFSWDPGNPLYYSKTKKQEVSKVEEKNVCKPWGGGRNKIESLLGFSTERKPKQRKITGREIYENLTLSSCFL